MTAENFPTSHGKCAPREIATASKRAKDKTRLRDKLLCKETYKKLGANALLLGLTLGISGKYAVDADQWAGDHIWPSTQPISHELTLGDYKDFNPTHGTFVFGGFGIKNGAAIAEGVESSLSTQGRVFGIEYDDQGIQIPNLASLVIDDIDEKNLKEFSLYGHSMGGDVALLVAEDILKRRPDLNLTNIFLDCTPASIDAVRIAGRGSEEIWYKLFADYKIYGGPILRILAELPNSTNTDFVSFSKSPPFVDPSNLISRILTLKKEKLNDQAPSNMMLLSQIDTIVSMNVNKSFSNLSQLTKNQNIPLRITEIRPRDDSLDGTVFNDISEKQFTEASQKSGIDFTVYNLEGKHIHHADPPVFPKEYNAILKQIYARQAYENTPPTGPHYNKGLY